MEGSSGVKRNCYVNSAVEFENHKTLLKSVPCPQCRAVSNLICHGYLRGYGECGFKKVVRGWRVFCSNRYLRQGCGRTYSILLAHFLHRRSVTSAQAWDFFKGLLSGMNFKTAWEKVVSSFSLECGYRLWKAFKRGQFIVRSNLCRMSSPQESHCIGANPLLQPIEQLRRVFESSCCPVSAYQIRFQAALLQWK